jgi:hypothetical protein
MRFSASSSPCSQACSRSVTSRVGLSAIHTIAAVRDSDIRSDWALVRVAEQPTVMARTIGTAVECDSLLSR